MTVLTRLKNDIHYGNRGTRYERLAMILRTPTPCKESLQGNTDHATVVHRHSRILSATHPSNGLFLVVSGDLD